MTAFAAIAAVVLLVANGMFVAAEFALIAARSTRLEEMADEGSHRAAMALDASRNLGVMLAAAQLGVTMASLGLGFVSEPAIGHLVESALGGVSLSEGVEHSIGVAVALLVATYLHMVFGEMAPKNVAIAYPERTAMALAGPMHGFTIVLRPAIVTLNGLANRLVRLAGIEPRDELGGAHTIDELASMLSHSRAGGEVTELEHRLLEGALVFRRATVADVMVPWSQVVAIPHTATAAEIEQLVRRSGHSRLPVYGRDRDDVLGFVHAKALLEVNPLMWHQPLPSRHLRRMLLVALEQRLPDVLVEMRRAGVHVGVVVDAAGHTRGIVTMEDVVEALVGDIRDEYDRVRYLP